jgi:CRISPR-associated protein Cas1
MKLLTIDGYGYNLSVDGGRLEATNGHHINRPKQTTKYRRKQIDFDKVVISGNHGNLSVSAIRWLMRQKLDIAILDWNGRLVTSMSPMIANLGTIKLVQYEAYRNPVKKAKIAKWLIKQKIEGSLRVLDWLSKTYDRFTYDKVIHKYAQELDNAKDISSVSRVESLASRTYWISLAPIFDKKWEFLGRNFTYNRSSRDDDDPVNALFNYGFSVLESECWKVVNTVGLEPYIGFIHKTYVNKAPLIYDLQEPFRWIVEIAILKILSEKRITKSDFITTEEGNVRLKPRAVKIVLDEIARQFSAKIGYKGMMREWQTMIMIKARELTKLF